LPPARLLANPRVAAPPRSGPAADVARASIDLVFSSCRACREQERPPGRSISTHPSTRRCFSPTHRLLFALRFPQLHK
jgi:hypothetical protein